MVGKSDEGRGLDVFGIPNVLAVIGGWRAEGIEIQGVQWMSLPPPNLASAPHRDNPPPPTPQGFYNLDPLMDQPTAGPIFCQPLKEPETDPENFWVYFWNTFLYFG